MDLTIIIAHYDPGNNPDCVTSFEKTLQMIANQKENFLIEIIIADDGSPLNVLLPAFNTNILIRNGRCVFDITGSKLKEVLCKKEINNGDISHWLYLPKDKQCMSKARLWNVAASLAESDNLFFLDDDNYFISQHSIRTVMYLLKMYSVVFGQIRDANGRFRQYDSKRVQGTTFGIRKNILNEIDGFGEWTEEISCGIDSDFWFKLFGLFHKNNNYKACFTDTIQTIDSCSKRWKPFIGTFFRKKKSIQIFRQYHNCKNYRNSKQNLSRIKHLWITDLTDNHEIESQGDLVMLNY